MSLSSLIVQREVATMRQVEEALSRQVLYGGDLVTNLLEVAQLPEEVLVPLLAESLGMPYAPLGELPPPDERARSLVPEELASRRAVMPLRIEAGKLLLAVAEPLPGDVLDELSFALGMPIEQRVAPMVRIRQAIAAWYGVVLERRMQRLIGRLGGEATDPGSLPPLLRNAPHFFEAPRPLSVPPAARLPDLPDLRPKATPTAEVAPVESVPITPPFPFGAARADAPAPAHGSPISFPEPPSESGWGDPELDAPARRDVPEVDLRTPEEIRTHPTPAQGSQPPRRPSQPPKHPTNVGFPAVRQPSPAAAAPRADGTPKGETPRPPESLVQVGRAGLITRPGRRRRGPLALAQAKEELDEASDRDTLLDLYFDFACQFFDYTALFIVHGDIAEGRDAFGSGSARETVAAIGVPLDLPGMLATAKEKCAPIVVRPAPTGLDHVLMGDLGRKTRTPILVVPVVVRGRAVAIVVGDGGDAGVDGASQGEVTSFATLVGQAFERIIVRRKLAGFTGAAGDEAGQTGAAKVDPTRVGSKPPRRAASAPPVNRATAAEVLERALFAQRPGAARKSSPLAETLPPPTASPSPADAGAPAAAEATAPAPPVEPAFLPSNEPDLPRPETTDQPASDVRDVDLFAQVSALPPPPQVLIVRRPTLPPIPREEPDVDVAPTIRDDPSMRRFSRSASSNTPGARPSEATRPPRQSSRPPPPVPPDARPRGATPLPPEASPLAFEPTPSVSAVSSAPPAARGPRPTLASAAVLDAIHGPAPHDPRVEPDDAPAIEEDESLVDALVEEPPSPEQGGGALVQQSVAPHRPPASARSITSDPLPSVIVDVEREFTAMVERLIAEPADEHAAAELLRQGQYAMPAIMARFPGPLTIQRESMEEMSAPRVTDCGPILRLIAGQRRVALPFVLAQVDSRDKERRFWATFLLSELAYPEAVPAVVSRLFDDDEGTRRVARLAARAVAEVAPEPLVERLDRIVGDPQASPERRVATIDTLGDMRDAIVVPALIGALGDESEEVAQAARRALMTVTRQDFGGESRKWLMWWGQNSSRARIEWLIDALTHDLPAIRRVAGQELKAITKEYFGYYDDLPKKERERAQQRYREWWKTEGRARFRRGREL